MCGRVAQYRSMADYVEVMDSPQQVLPGFDAIPLGRYNIAQTTSVGIFRSDDAGLHIDRIRWGWAPFWAKGKRPDPINARVETVTTGKFFKQLWPNGRVIVAVDGWYEWVKDESDPKRKQPYFIVAKDNKPLLLAGLAEVHPGLETDERDGFVIITADSDQGMVDIHDRRPVVLSPEHAREWVDPETTRERAAEIARECCRPTEEFTWFEVRKDVGNVRNQGPHLIEPKDQE